MSQKFWFNFIFAWLGLMAMATADGSSLRPETVCGITVFRWKKSRAVLAFWPVYYAVVFTAARYDMVLYLQNYDSLPSTFSGLLSSVRPLKSGSLYETLGILIRCVFGTDRRWFRIIMGLLHSVPLIHILRRYSENYLFSLFIFAAFGCQQGWMMNGMRQFLAVVMIFAATPWMLEKKYLKAVLTVLIASRVHTSALVMLPLIFICGGEAWNRKTVLLLAGAAAAAAVFANVTGSFDRLLTGTEYEGAGAYWRANGDDGMSVLRALVYAVPTVIAFIGRKRLRAENDPLINFCVNMSVANLGISLIAVVTSGILVGRLPIYTNMYNFMVLPGLISRTFSRENAGHVTFLAIIGYMIFYKFETGM